MNIGEIDEKNNKDKTGKIGVFDSGFGGLDIFRHISNGLPENDFVYLGDTARTPYGNRSKEKVYQYVREGMDFLFDHGCKIIILACNTASADALRKIQQEYLVEKFGKDNNGDNDSFNENVLGVIIPAAEEAAQTTKNNKVGVIATEGSVNSGAFIRELQKEKEDIQVFQKACPLLAPLVEADEVSDEIVMPILENYLKPLVENDIDTIILGCTHYGILKDQIKRSLNKMNSNAKIISEGEIVAQKLSDYLNRHKEISESLSKKSTRSFYTTDTPEKFSEIGSRIIGKRIVAEKVNITTE